MGKGEASAMELWRVITGGDTASVESTGDLVGVDVDGVVPLGGEDEAPQHPRIRRYRGKINADDGEQLSQIAVDADELGSH